MRWIAELATPKLRRFEIRHDQSAGFYLYVFEGDRCTHDYLQDTLELAMEQAQTEFDVGPNLWQKTGSF